MKTHRNFLAATAALLLGNLPGAAASIDDALVLLRKGDIAAAEAMIAPLAAGDVPGAAALDALGQVRLVQKRTRDAVDLAERATRLDPKNADYFSRLGIAHSARMPELGFMQQAMVAGKMRKAFETAVALDPKHVPGLIGLARYYSNAPEIAGGSPEKAREFANRVREINPFTGELELARIAERAQALEEALRHYRAAAALNPPHAGARNGCGRVLVKLGRPGEARTEFEAALKLDPALESARTALAELK